MARATETMHRLCLVATSQQCSQNHHGLSDTCRCQPPAAAEASIHQINSHCTLHLQEWTGQEVILDSAAPPVTLQHHGLVWGLGIGPLSSQICEAGPMVTDSGSLAAPALQKSGAGSDGGEYPPGIQPKGIVSSAR